MTQPAADLTARRMAPATDRNRAPILAVLRDALPRDGTALEIASGTGQHVVHFAAALPGLTWQPSDPDATHRESIAAWTAHAQVTNVLPPLAIDVRQEPWGIGTVNAILCINMIHIAPWAAAEALFAGAGTRLAPGGVLYLYGPYRRNGAHTAPSNEAFDRQLRIADADWGVRDMEDVIALGAAQGLTCDEPIPMPANNFSLVFHKHG
jgi:SAM-dependent methyltransferase